MSPRVVAIVQARMGSSRLPGKVLLPLGSRSVLSWVVRAACAAKEVDDVVVATSTEPQDELLASACAEIGVKVVRGDETDVLSRFILAAQDSQADAIVRLTADCPLLDPALIDQVVSVWRADPALEYVSTSLHRTFPRGVDVELVTRGALEIAGVTAHGADRTHVTSCLYAPGSSVLRAGVAVLPENSDLRVTLDVKDDYELLSRLVALIPDEPPSWRTIVAALRMRPDLVDLNRHVIQKRTEDG